MTRSPDRLFDLLPAVHRRRDAEQGYPLRALLQVIAQQVQGVEDDIAQLYDNWFIETCDDWVVPYLGDLVGFRAVNPGGPAPAAGGRLGRILAPRREVANTIRSRRRKGSLSLLELLAHDVAGWPARAVEFYPLLAWTQSLNHLRPGRGGCADLRQGGVLDLLEGPFDTAAHTADVRRLSTQRTRGRYGIPGVGVFVWRLKAQPVTHGPAYCYESYGSSFYTFSVLGNDAPLFTRAQPEPSPEHLAGPLHVPAPIRRHALEQDLKAYYGPERSFAVWVDGWAGHPEGGLLPPDALIVADLSEWTYRPPRGRVAIDPVRGRLAFPPRQLPRNGVWVSYHQGFSDDMGGGEYARPLTQPAGAVVYRVGQAEEMTRLGEALARWREKKPRHAVVEITDSGVYVEQINVELDEGQSLQLRAAEHTRPVLRLMDWQTSLPDALAAYGAPGSRFVLDGLLVAGRSVRCEGPLAEVTIRHCTLVPGWGLGPDCSPRRPAEPSLELTDTVARVVIERTILGSIQVSMDEVGADPVAIRISDSILDATGNELEAVGAPTWPLAHAELTILRTTVFGEIQAHAIRLAENSIFMGRIRVARRQLGCMRFCYVTPGSRTPRRYRCQPDLAEEAARATLPRVEVGADARLRLGAAEEDVSCVPPAESANLEITLESSDPAPAPEQPFQLLVTVVNCGPRAASGVVVELTAPAGGCLRPAQAGSPGDLVNVSQGEMDPLPAGRTLRWRVGALAAGARARMKLGDLVRAGDEECPAIIEVTAAIVRHALAGDAQAFLQPVLRRARQRVRPRFNSTRYGTPAYAQLALHCAPEITRGADDESEMGAFHDLFQPQRASNLEARLDEFVPAGTDAAIIYAS